MLLTILLSIAGVLALGGALFFIVVKVRIRGFRPNPDKAQQQREINRDLEAAGFAYDRRRDLFYARMDCWQRKMGYCRLYDEGSPAFGMVMHCEPIPFSYAGKRWLIELWKGQYGLTTGAEIGVYNTDKDDIRSEKFTGVFYEAVPEKDFLPMSFVLRRNGRVFFRCSGRHWWLTGFRLGVFSHRDSLQMDAKIRFPNAEMRRAFVNGLREIGYTEKEFSVWGGTVSIHFDTPHSAQPQTAAQTAVAQQANKTNCNLLNNATRDYPDTLDKLEYVKTGLPELYTFCMRSLYSRGLYDAFTWLIEWISGGNQPPAPNPPAPPPPLPPSPPCSCRRRPCRYRRKCRIRGTGRGRR